MTSGTNRKDGSLSAVLSVHIDHNELFDKIADKKDFNAV